MGSEETKETGIEARVRIINDASNGLLATVIALAKADNAPPGCDTILAHSLTLVNCGLIALTEIADAQQRMAQAVELDTRDQVDAMANERAETIAAGIVEEKTKRSFIGQKQK